MELTSESACIQLKHTQTGTCVRAGLAQAGSWHQVPVPRGLRGLCKNQPAKDFIPAGAELEHCLATLLLAATQNESMDSEHSISIHVASIPL